MATLSGSPELTSIIIMTETPIIAATVSASLVTETVTLSSITSTDSTSATSVFVTPTTYIPLTTKYTFPSDCISVTQTEYYTGYWFSTNHTFNVLTSAQARPIPASCQPPGWLAAGSTQVVFSPGVCPRGWLTGRMSTTSRDGKLMTTAKCCKSGYTASSTGGLYTVESGVSKTLNYGCYSKSKTAGVTTTFFPVTDTGSSPTPVIISFEEVIKIHQPYSVEWQEKDVFTMLPRPATFTPYVDCPGISCNQEARIAVIVISCVLVPLILLVTCCVCHSRRRSRRRATLAALEGGHRTSNVNETGLPVYHRDANVSTVSLELSALAVDDVNVGGGRTHGDGPPAHDFDPPPQYRTRSSTLLSTNRAS